jgi:hypothetical protein
MYYMRLRPISCHTVYAPKIPFLSSALLAVSFSAFYLMSAGIIAPFQLLYYPKEPVISAVSLLQ